MSPAFISFPPSGQRQKMGRRPPADGCQLAKQGQQQLPVSEEQFAQYAMIASEPIASEPPEPLGFPREPQQSRWPGPPVGDDGAIRELEASEASVSTEDQASQRGEFQEATYDFPNDTPVLCMSAHMSKLYCRYVCVCVYVYIYTYVYTYMQQAPHGPTSVHNTRKSSLFVHFAKLYCSCEGGQNGINQVYVSSGHSPKPTKRRSKTDCPVGVRSAVGQKCSCSHSP